MKRLLLLCFIFDLFERKATGFFIDPDSYRTVQELITLKGYPLEEYTVRTRDGYLLSMQRIPHGRYENTSSIPTRDKEVVLLVHGEVGDAKTWFLNPPGQSLGYILPDAGYDVWMINQRGSDYSQRNVEYSNRDYRFWNFSFDEQGLIDLPDTIDYVLNATGKESLHLIGYSRGNTVFFALLSEKPEYNAKVKIAIALAPIAFIGNFRIAVIPVIPFAEGIALSINLVTQGEFFPHNVVTKIIVAEFCQVTNLLEICQDVLYALAGVDRKEMNNTRMPIYAAQYFSSTSTKALVHFAQLYRSKLFRKYDYGSENMERYNQLEPPDYPLSQITAPIALFSSQNDKIADAKDVDILVGKLNKKTLVYWHKEEIYNHFDFILGKNSPQAIYSAVLQLLANYSQPNNNNNFNN